jgi:hypothetical protein
MVRDKVVCERWCVTDGGGGRGVGGGIQNQKQEPHTKMWGEIPSGYRHLTMMNCRKFKQIFGLSTCQAALIWYGGIQTCGPCFHGTIWETV